ncbi:UNVERIFIED_CONTAM: hypothetical protein HDU68_001504 [Siphonaria sp. JEL0065]|nr:hypothetical protein HDU68_001504 [Siphonaria sp. JEL0065]
MAFRRLRALILVASCLAVVLVMRATSFLSGSDSGHSFDIPQILDNSAPGTQAFSSTNQNLYIENEIKKPSVDLPCFFASSSAACAFTDYSWAPLPKTLLQPRVKTRAFKNNTAYTQWKFIDRAPTNSSRISSRTKINILYFNERREYLEKMDRYYYDEVKSAAEHPGLEVRMWGPGWQGYNTSMTARENIEATFPGLEFDLIYTKTWHHNVTSSTAVVIHGTGDLSESLVYVLPYQMDIGDCHRHKCIKDEYYPTHADAITFRYAGLIMEFSRPEQWYRRESIRVSATFPSLDELSRKKLEQPMPFFFHSPDCADESIMHPIPHSTASTSMPKWEDSRPNLIQLIGSTRKTMYPLRHKVKQGIKAGKIQNAKVYEHVGYVLKGGVTKTVPVRQDRIGVFDPLDPDVAHHRKNQQNWAKTLATTQICVFDSSIVRKAIRKYQESFMSGCVVAADIPLEMENMFRNVVIPLKASMSIEQINETLQEYLKDKARLSWMAQEAFKRARANWTCRNKVNRLLEAAEMVVGGDRGYWGPFCFSSTFRKFDSNTGTEWCNKE